MSATDPMVTAKAAAARHAAGLVEDGMVVGIGTGSTARHLIQALGERVREGLRITGVPTSEETAALAREAGIPLSDLEGDALPDLTIDGADEVDEELQLIKGGGGALLREKIVSAASRRMVVIADAGKRVAALGAFPLPVEVVTFGLGATRAAVAEVLGGADVLGREVVLRERDGAPFMTDGGHLILDLHLRRIGDPRALALALNQVPGVVETGLFCDMCDLVVFGHGDGRTDALDVLGARARRETGEDTGNAFAGL